MSTTSNLKGSASYIAFEACTVPVCGQQQSGARVTCGWCGTVNTIAVNSFARGGMEGGDAKRERFVAHKFENMGWKIGKDAKGNRCPGCYSKIKLAAKAKHEAKMKENDMSNGNKVVPIVKPIEPAPAPEPPIAEHKGMTRDDRRIILFKLHETYDKVGYHAGWNDQRIATDLGVPIGWVETLREENFGPNTDQRTATLIADAQQVLADIKSEIAVADAAVGPIARRLQDLIDRTRRIEELLRGLEK